MWCIAPDASTVHHHSITGVSARPSLLLHQLQCVHQRDGYTHSSLLGRRNEQSQRYYIFRNTLHCTTPTRPGFRQSNQCMGVLQSKRRCTISHDDRRGAPEARRPLCETHAEASWAGRSPARPCREPPTLQINYMFVPVVSSKRPNQYMCRMLASRTNTCAAPPLGAKSSVL